MTESTHLRDETEATPAGICHTCRRRSTDRGDRCQAYPNGIPVEILAGITDHHHPQPGDNGLLYVPFPPATTGGQVAFFVVYIHGQLQGALWVGTDEEAIGWEPGDQSDLELAAHWRGSLAYALRAGDGPAHIFEAWQAKSNGITVACGDVIRATGLQQMREYVRNLR